MVFLIYRERRAVAAAEKAPKGDPTAPEISPAEIEARRENVRRAEQLLAAAQRELAEVGADDVVFNVETVDPTKINFYRNRAVAYDRMNAKNGRYVQLLECPDDGILAWLTTNRDYDMNEFADAAEKLGARLNGLTEPMNDLLAICRRKIQQSEPSAAPTSAENQKKIEEKSNDQQQQKPQQNNTEKSEGSVGAEDRVANAEKAAGSGSEEYQDGDCARHKDQKNADEGTTGESPECDDTPDQKNAASEDTA